MKRLNIHAALMALEGTGTKEDIIIQVAKHQNIRFNDLPQLQKEVDLALEESHRLGFIDRQGAEYKSNYNPCPIVSKDRKDCIQLVNDVMQGQGDCRRSRSGVVSKTKAGCLGCGGIAEPQNIENFLDKHLLIKGKSTCSVCGITSESQLTVGDPESTDSNWLSAHPLA